MDNIRKYEKKLMDNIRKYQVPLQKYMVMMELQVSLFTSFIFTLSFEIVHSLLGLQVLGKGLFLNPH